MASSSSTAPVTLEIREVSPPEHTEAEYAFNPQLLALLLHDLETPLAVTKQFIDRVEQGRHDPGNPRHRAVLASTQLAMQRAERILQDVLDLARATNAGGFPLEMRSIDIRQQVQHCFTVVQLLAQDKNLHLECRVDGDFPKNVPCDKRLVERIIDNLLVNAIRHTPLGASIICHLGLNHGAARIEVINPHESAEILDFSGIFEPHRQVEFRRKNHWRSAGLGLTFCRFAVEAHEGRIGAHCDRHSFVTFWFELPIG